MAERIIITGATGFMGKPLCGKLAQDYEIVVLSRSAGRAKEILADTVRVHEWDGKSLGGWVGEINGVFAAINLAGENVASGRWSRTRKTAILNSRLNAVDTLIKAIRQTEIKPKVFVQASAVGYYGPRGDEQLDENAHPGDGFLAEVCRKLEIATSELEAEGVRCVLIRTGVVLGSNGGALEKLIKPFRIYLGGYPGTGWQWFSWISLEDQVNAIKFLIENENLQGAFNLTSPEPVMMKDFCNTLGKVLNKPSWIKIPGFVLRFALGRMADEMLLAGQRVLPARLARAGFEFKHAGLESALKAVLQDS